MNALEVAMLIEPLDRADIIRDPETGLYIIPTVPPTEITLAQLDDAESILLIKRKAHAEAGRG